MRWTKIAANLLGVAILLFIAVACKPQMEELSFETIAQKDIINYREESPALLVIANNDEIDALVPNVLAEDPLLVDQLRRLDYDHFFAILVLQGQKGSTGYAVTVKQIVRQGNQVNIYAEVSGPEIGTRRKPAFTSPYHLIAVSKQRRWEQQIKFVLVVNDKSVAEATHFIP